MFRCGVVTSGSSCAGRESAQAGPARRRWSKWISGIALSLLVVAGLSPVADAAAPTLKLLPGSTIVGVGGTMRFVAVYDPDGSGPALPQFVDGAQATWKSNNAMALIMDKTGLGLGWRAGTAKVKVTYAGLTASSDVTVAGTLNQYSLVTPDGRTRTYLLYVPTGYTGAGVPLVLAFHGGHGGNSFSLMYGSQLNNVAHANNFVVAYPDGTDEPGGYEYSFNGGGCCGYAAEAGVDDVGFVRLLLADIGTRVKIKPKKIYAAGISNGAVLSHRLGVELSDRIAAIATIAGGIEPGGDFEPTPPTRPVSVIQFHGTTDYIYPYVVIPATISYWKARNGITAKKVPTYANGIEKCVSHLSATSEVVFCTAKPPEPIIVNGIVYDGGGHAWPGGVKANADWTDVPTPDLDASSTMWEFFKKHPMP